MKQNLQVTINVFQPNEKNNWNSIQIRITLSVVVAAVRHAWIPSYLPNLMLPTIIWFKLKVNAGRTEKLIIA